MQARDTPSAKPGGAPGIAVAILALSLVLFCACSEDTGGGVGVVSDLDAASDADDTGGGSDISPSDVEDDVEDDVEADVVDEDQEDGSGEDVRTDVDPDVDGDSGDVGEELTCTSCHGSGGDPAPPLGLAGETETTSVGVGAHQSHLAESSWHAQVRCEDCHVVPTALDDEGHVDDPRPADLVWSELAAPDGFPEPTWSEATCEGVYCHGATLPPSGTLTTPKWTNVGEGEAGCGTCHGAPPSWPHPESFDCAQCHATMGPNWEFVQPDLHINGVVDLLPLDCTSCHGNANNAAPPNDTLAQSATSAVGVGAHQSHLGASSWHLEIPCEECHTVPTTINAEGHRDSPLPAELDFGPLATLEGQIAPDWNGDTCTNTYCHGSTLSGPGERAPEWTRVGRGEASCGTCHGVPPLPPHPNDSNCNGCHDNLGTDFVFTDPERHIDGHLDLVDLPCNACHGSEASPAPPSDLSGSSDTADKGVGAHQSHLRASDWRAEIACTECHRVPTTLGDEGHIDSTPSAELEWGARATSNDAAPDWDGVECSGTYCHGSTLEPTGANTTPTWTNVDTGEASCGSCHGAPPDSPTHPARTDCATCHPTMNAAGDFIAPERHIDGNLDLLPLSCTTCHGSGSDPAPPLSTSGGSNTSLRGVGAHQSHLGASSWHLEIQCEACHNVPSDILAPGHIDSDLPAEVVFHDVAVADGATGGWDGTRCTNSYCHGPTLGAGGSLVRPTWTRVDGSQASCGTCHTVNARNLSGEHDKHVREENIPCSGCHSNMANDGSILFPDQHIDGILQIAPIEGLEWNGTSCNGDCHGEEHRGESW